MILVISASGMERRENHGSILLRSYCKGTFQGGRYLTLGGKRMDRVWK